MTQHADVTGRTTPGRARRTPRDGLGTGHKPGSRRLGIRPEDIHQAQQEAGLAVLAGIASHASLAMAEAATTILPTLAGWLPEDLRPERSHRPDEDPVPKPDASARPGPIRWIEARILRDHLVRSSLSLMISAVVQAVLGFGFWLVMARLFSAGDVGRASSLISATSLISYFSLVGLNITLMRFLPTSRDRGPLLTAAFVMVLGTGAVIGLGYVLLTPVIAPRLAFVAHNPLMTVGFVLLTAATAVNLLTDAIFVTSRRAGLCAVTDGLVGGVSKIILGLILVGAGAYGLYLASVGGFAAAALVSIVLIMKILHWRPSLKHPLQVLKPLLRFTGANYVASALNMLPSVLVPLIVLDRLGAKSAGYYFVAFQMAALLYAAIHAVESSFLAEGSQAGADWRAIRRRSRRLALVLFVPSGVALAVAARWVLLAFGGGYSQHGAGSLEVLAAAVLPMAACNWTWTVLKLTGRLSALLVSTAVYACAICGIAWVLAPHGLTALSMGWLAGSAIGAVVATSVRLVGRKQAQHRRTRRPAVEQGAARSRGQVEHSLPTR